jgi:dihydrofolate reductase
MVIGGAEIYAQTIAIAAAMYLTLVDAQVHADAWFPSFDAADWEVCREEEHPVTDERPLGFRFVDYRRRDRPR